MNKSQAKRKLGLSTEHSAPEDIKSAYTKLKHEIEEKLKANPTEELLQEYKLRLKEVEEAHNILLSSEKTVPPNDLSASMIHDLPSERPSYTNLDNTSLGDQIDPSIAFPIGYVLIGRYEILGLLDVGGMGAVYSAHDRIKDETIAIKVLLPRLLGNQEARKRFINEAKIATSLSHPCIVNVFDVQMEGDVYFITMEKLEGCSLRTAMKERKSNTHLWSVEEVCDIGYQLCDALSFAHKTTVHRDIKPENIWLCKDNQVKIMDFGIARFLSSEKLTATSVAMGTPYYMAPEQIHNTKNIDHRADQYSVGAVLYELLTEHVPSGRFKAPNKFRKDIPSKLSQSILKALESTPKDRFLDIADFGKQLKKCRKGSFLKHKHIVWPAIIIIILLLLFPLWKKPILSFFNMIRSIVIPVTKEQIDHVKARSVDIDIILQNIGEMAQYKGDDINKKIQLLKIKIPEVQDSIRKEDYRKAYKLIIDEIDEKLSVLNGQFYRLSFESNERCELSIKNFEVKKDEIKKACDESKSRYNTQPRSPLLDVINCELARIFNIQLTSEAMIKVKAVHKEALNAIREKQYFLGVALLDETTRKYNSFYFWIESARTFITDRYKFKLQSVLDDYRNNYPFIKEPFYQKFIAKDEMAINILSNGDGNAAKKQFNDLQSNFEDAKKLADRYKKDYDLLKILNNDIPKSFQNRLNEMINLLDQTKEQIALHEFNKATNAFESIESNRFKLINDSMDSELRNMETKIKSGVIYPVLILLNKFEKTWGNYLERSIENKKRFAKLWTAVKNPVIVLGDGVVIEMVYIWGGKFQMGSPISEPGRYEEEIRHPVEVGGFWIGKCEVTQEQYLKIMQANPSTVKNSKNPVENVTWIEARGFCSTLSNKTGKIFRLPTEAEWEYACRAGTQTPYYWGDQWNSSQSLAGSARNSPSQVGEFPPNNWNLRDMIGNVREWCGDFYQKEYYNDSPQKNPSGPTSGSERVVRGGSFSTSARACRSAYRDFKLPDSRSPSLGFRVVYTSEVQNKKDDSL